MLLSPEMAHLPTAVDLGTFHIVICYRRPGNDWNGRECYFGVRVRGTIIYWWSTWQIPVQDCIAGILWTCPIYERFSEDRHGDISPVIRVFTAASKTNSTTLDHHQLPGQVLPAVTPSSLYRSPQAAAHLNINTNQDGGDSAGSDDSYSPMRGAVNKSALRRDEDEIGDRDQHQHGGVGKSVKIMVDRQSDESSDYKMGEWMKIHSRYPVISVYSSYCLGNLLGIVSPYHIIYNILLLSSNIILSNVFNDVTRK